MNEKYGINNEQTPLIFNHFLFSKLSFLDIAHMTKQVITEDDEYEANLASRHLTVHLYDFMDKTKDFLGKKMRDELSLLFPDSDFLKSELQQLKSVYTQIKLDIFGNLQDVRHSTVAHKDTNALKLSSGIKNISADKIDSACFQVFLLFRCIVSFHENILYTFKLQCENAIVAAGNVLNEDNKMDVEKPKTIKAVCKKLLLVLKGVDDKLADDLSELTPAGLKKLGELQEYLENK